MKNTCLRLSIDNSETAKRTNKLYSRVQHVSLSSSSKESTRNNSHVGRANMAAEVRRTEFNAKDGDK